MHTGDDATGLFQHIPRRHRSAVGRRRLVTGESLHFCEGQLVRKIRRALAELLGRRRDLVENDLRATLVQASAKDRRRYSNYTGKK